MLRLYVMRHAKSSWAAPGARDFDRDLNERGESDLTKVSSALQSRGYIPGQILCSSAARTRQTLEGISSIIPESTPTTFTEKLYSSGLDDYITLIQAQNDTSPLMIIGHNPMCGTLAANLSGTGKHELLEEIAYKYPTATIAVIEFDCNEWSAISAGSGELIDCIIPSRL